MKTLRFLLEKEFRQIFRNKSILAIIMVMPIMQLIILPLAADYEVKYVKIVIIDHDHSSTSTQLRNTILSSSYFQLVDFNNSYVQSLQLLESDQADVILEIPAKLDQLLVREQHASLFITVNAINGVKASLGAAYLVSIIRNFNQKLIVEQNPLSQNAIAQSQIRSSDKFNPLLNYKYFMVPGILAILVTMISGFLSALNIVKEKEIGTIEQINVSPVKKYQFVLGKLIPFWVLGNIVFTIGLLVARIFYGIIPEGPLLALYAFLAIYLFALLGFGLFVSTFCENQQQAMLIMFFFMMVFVLLGGLFTPIESMPAWAQTVAAFNPASYFIKVMRMVILKGSGFVEVAPFMLKILGFAVVLNLLAILNYRKISA